MSPALPASNSPAMFVSADPATHDRAAVPGLKPAKRLKTKVPGPPGPKRNPAAKAKKRRR